MPIGKVGRRGQITIPRSIRRKLKVREGDSIAFIERDDEVVLQPITQTLLDLRGSVPVTKEQDFDAIRERMIAERAQRVASNES